MGSVPNEGAFDGHADRDRQGERGRDIQEKVQININEELLAKAVVGRRDDVVIATRFGALRHRADNSYGLGGSPENLRISSDGSLTRLGTDYIDIYYQHRMDPDVPIEETVGALATLIAEGKIRGCGLSEAAPATICRAHATHPVTAVQSEYSLDQLDEADFRRTNPRFAGENPAANIAIVEQVDAIASDVGLTTAQVALAWLLAQGDDIVPIPGTKRLAYLEENVGADAVTLTPAQLDALGALSAPVGDRYLDMSTINR